MSDTARISGPVPVGAMPDGRPILEARLAGEGLAVSILDLGAVIRRLDFHGHPMVLGRDDPHDYVAKTPQCGAIVGRFANRIAGGRFTLDGTTYDLPRNEAGRNHLHGGAAGFSRRNWTFAEVGERSLTLTYRAADGEEGYPGALDVACTYAITGPGTLRITLTARTDEPTIVNLTNHSYFNLLLPRQGFPAPTIDDHVIEIPAESYLPVDDGQIPTGEIAPVAGTRFDLRRPTRIGGRAFDHAFVLGRETTPEPRTVGRVTAAGSDVALTVLATAPAVQFYDGTHLAKAGLGFAARSALCLEPEAFPDAPNHPGFPSATLRPGETYRQIIEYRFTKETAR
ncbi:aldose epimerase family protein [Methylobacterium frigidaeris]|uniref:Aldose 1-epimerase n=1 Tax=Methylobacterium frigidaeris TaxID=2038277 RepID=A0AA37H9I4_9HYPH|nr:aldose epimerase family protein [Methylobacterium frigidaeris]PIK74610.1 galactose-1-epimerase [Methylobacterium frigidaeris]GJD61816.1 Aldose 1-epimerase [Methylobacterium frigidaeris]